MKLVTNPEMRSIDKTAIKKLKIPGITLMENAGIGLFNIIRKQFKGLDNLKIGIICGKGNNGGDGFVVARLLIKGGAEVNTFLLGKAEEVKGDAKTNLDALLKAGCQIIELKNEKNIKSFDTRSCNFDLLVDAIFGTGFSGKITGIPEKVIKLMNKSGVPILSADIPSGVNADDGSVDGTCVKASFTGTMCLPKRGLFLYPGKDYAGDIYIIDIGAPAKLWNNLPLELLEPSDISKVFPIRPDNSNKGSFGKVFVLAGSQNMTGAAGLTALSALKIGAGLVRLGIPESINRIIKSLPREIITVSLPATKDGTFSKEGESRILEEISKATVVVVGPGLSTSDELKTLLKSLLPGIKVPLIIDADGLNNLSAKDIKKVKCPLIITPHPGELSRLTGLSISGIQATRIDTAFKFAKAMNVVLVLKGAPTIISYNNKGYLNPFYNSALAKAGTGDVLTGIIAGLLAQKLKPVDAARCGVWVHSMAAELISRKLTKYSVLAEDIIKSIPLAIKSLNLTTGELGAPR